MTPVRAKQILEAGDGTGKFREHLTLEEEDQVYDIWAAMERSSSFKEVLTLIATGQNLDSPTDALP